MTMDVDPRIRLSFLYQNDPFYSLCLSDLMTAPQRIQNKFLKEQKNLTVTVKKLEHQKLTRLRQLNEEKRQFSLLMKKRLAPTVSVRSGSSLAPEKGSQRIYSSVKFSSLASSKSSRNSAGAVSGPKAAEGFPSAFTRELPTSRTSKFCKMNSVPEASRHFGTFGVPGKAKGAFSEAFVPQKKGEHVVTKGERESDWLTARLLVDQSAKGMNGLKSEGNFVHLALIATITLDAGTLCVRQGVMVGYMILLMVCKSNGK
ncbi:UNVERIFIED_CONTAM: hypothetical protein K2H54_009412 [Gekko kuhli]